MELVKDQFSQLTILIKYYCQACRKVTEIAYNTNLDIDYVLPSFACTCGFNGWSRIV
jgi:hypothetical protein